MGIHKVTYMIQHIATPRHIEAKVFEYEATNSIYHKTTHTNISLIRF